LAVESIKRVEKAIEEIRVGRMVILVDDEDRENEGDLCMAAEAVTPEAITFMATKACGLICLAMTPERVEYLRLPMMVRENRSRFETAFTVSIEAREGVTTGISAADRATTIRKAVDRDAQPDDLVSPGHIFPLRASPGGVLQRVGQTEGSVDLARLAGMTPAGVICEIMRPDGTMARMPDLRKFAQEHDLMLLSIADMVSYRLQKDRLVRRIGEAELSIGHERKKNRVMAFVYEAVPGIERSKYLAVVFGDLNNGDPPLCRVHAGCLLADVFGVPHFGEHVSVRQAISTIENEGRGVFLYLPPVNGLSSEDLVKHKEGADDDPHHHEGQLREFGIGAQILADLGVKKLRLISSSPRKLFGLRGFGLEVVEQIACEEEGK